MSERERERMEDALRRKQEEAKARAEDSLRAHERPPDEASPRQKSTGHKKVTADKWNQ
jgi:hypothetical protein